MHLSLAVTGATAVATTVSASTTSDVRARLMIDLGRQAYSFVMMSKALWLSIRISKGRC